jgi:tetratricopeptide (TPR) repeat protein
VDELAIVNSQLWHVFAAASSKCVVFFLVRAQLNVLVDALEQPHSESIHRRVCGLLGDLFQLAGEVFFDGNRYADAAHCYTLAASVSKEAGAYDLWACAMTRHAFIGVYERRFERAVPMLELAGRLARRGDGSLSTRHWVNAVMAQAHAGLGRLDACQRAIASAAQVNQLSGQVHNGGWLRFDGSRLAEERGACYVELGCPDLAEPVLTEALRQNLSARRRGSVLTDLAVVGAQRHDKNQLVRYGTDALQIAKQTGSGVVRRRLQGLQAHLAPHLADSQVRQLDQEITRLGLMLTAA